jgi:hypothetical protein
MSARMRRSFSVGEISESSVLFLRDNNNNNNNNNNNSHTNLQVNLLDRYFLMAISPFSNIQMPVIVKTRERRE